MVSPAPEGQPIKQLTELEMNACLSINAAKGICTMNISFTAPQMKPGAKVPKEVQRQAIKAAIRALEKAHAQIN